MLQGKGCLARSNVPQLDSEIAGGGGEDTFGSGVEENLSNFPVSDVRITLHASRSCPVYLECPASLLTGATSVTSSASVYKVKSCGTCHMNIFPSSEPEAMMWSLNGCLQYRQYANSRTVACSSTHQSVSRTTAVWPLNSGICSGSLPFSFNGMTANAPPPLDSQLTERYSGLAWENQT